MKPIYNIYTLLLAILMVSCGDYLDRASTTQRQDEDIFNNFTMTDQAVNALYGSTLRRSNYNYLGGYNMSSATDESKDASTWMASFSFNNGSWSSNQNPIGNTWREYYESIRMANLILEGIVEYNTPDDANNPGYLENRVGEVYFLRAYALFELVRQFGGVIIFTNTIEQTDEEALNRPRNTYDECVNQILADCDEAIARVPNTYPANQMGRVTRGAAMALKSKILLFSASPLWAEAGKTSFQGDISDNQTASDPEKWQRAAAAAKEIIDLGQYSLEPALEARQSMFTATTLQSSEVIFVRMNAWNQDMDRYFFPHGSSGWSGAAPTQNLVDDYEMEDGLPYNESPLYDEDNPYANRDPRFYTDISYNGAPWKDRVIETFSGGLDELSTQTDRTRTGYYSKKLVDESISVGQGQGRRVDAITFRLAEIYLNYVEALNEYDPGNPDILLYLNRIRERAGQVPISAGLSQEVMREKIRNERRIELSFENHRFWDVRRWKIAPQTEPTIYGMRALSDDSKPTGFRYERFKVEDRLWRNAMYLIPITQDETLRNPNLVQNQGW